MRTASVKAITENMQCIQCCYIWHGHVIFQMVLNVLWQVHKMVTACWKNGMQQQIFIYTTKIYIYTTVNFDLLLSSIIYHISLVCVLNFQKQSWSDKVLCFLALGSFVVGFLLSVIMKTWSGTGFSLVCNITLPLDDSLKDNSSLIWLF